MIPEIIFFSVISIFALLIRGKKLNAINKAFEIKGYQILIIAAAVELAAEFVYKNFSGGGLFETLYEASFYRNFDEFYCHYFK